MEAIWTQIGNLGFPIVVSIYLLVRVEKKLDALTEAIIKLRQVMHGEIFKTNLPGSQS